MKKIFILLSFLIASLSGLAQHGNFTDIRLINGDSILSGTGNGTMFYNRISNKFRFRQNGAWTSLGGNPFSDAQTLIKNGADPTKLAIFSASGITTATTRTYTLPNANGTLALLTDIPSTYPYWSLTGTSTLTTPGATITNNFANGLVFNGAWATIANASHLSISPTQTATSGSPVLNTLLINPTFVGTGTFYPLRVQSGGVDLMAVVSTGNILIGTTTDDAISKLQVNGNIGILQNGVNATTTLTQASSFAEHYKTSLWNGAAETKGWFTWRNDASTATNLDQDLVLYTSTGSSPLFTGPIFKANKSGIFEFGRQGSDDLVLSVTGGIGQNFHITTGGTGYMYRFYDNTSYASVKAGTLGTLMFTISPTVFTSEGDGIIKATLVVGGTTITNASTLLDLQSLTKAFKLSNVTNIASIVTPTLGMEAFDAATTLMNDYEGAGAWQTRAYVAKAQTLTNKTLTSSTNVLGGVTMTLGSDASYDMYHRGTGVLTRIANGTTGQVLTATTGGAPAWATTSSGITNTAAANELMKSNGTNAVPSGIFISAQGNLDLGTGLAGATRAIIATGSAAVVGLSLQSKGAGTISLYSPSGQTTIAGQTGTVNTITDVANNNVTSVFTVGHVTTGVVGVGIGAAFEFFTTTNTGNSTLGASITAITTNIGAGTEAFDLVFKTMTGGAAASEKVRIASTGNLTVGTANNIVGTATNNNATAGNIGEEISSTVSTYANFTTTATYQNITSISLTAGDWDLAAFFTYSTNSSTITLASNAIFVISTTTASAAGAVEGQNIAYVPQAALVATSKFSDAITPYRVSLSGTTTYYFNAQATFTVGNPQYVGFIRARRVR